MPSPFPGMNPYLEHPYVWADFHQTFLLAVRAALAPQAGPDYFVEAQEHLYLHEVGEDERRLVGVSDVNLTDAGRPPTPARGGGSVALTAPAQVTMPELVKERRTYLEVRDRAGRQVVTVIELLSPSNKRPGEDRETYLTKRRELLYNRVNLVELDLLRGGPRPPARGRPECDYCALVYRPPGRPRADFWPIRLRTPLPTIPVPLAAGERELAVDLQAALHWAYDTAGYAAHIYGFPPEPPLAADDAAWAAGFAPRPAGGG